MDKEILQEIRELYLHHKDFSVNMLDYKENIHDILKGYSQYLDRYKNTIDVINDKISGIKEREAVTEEDRKNLEFIQVLLLMGQQELVSRIIQVSQWLDDVMDMELKLLKDVFTIKKHLSLTGEHLQFD